MAEIRLTHNRSHALDGTDDHTVAGLSGVLKIVTGAVAGSAAHADLGSIGANDHHAQAHVLSGGDHTESGLTIGHVLTASGATAFGWSALPAFALATLGNLASVAINTTLLSDTDNTDDLGTTTARWRTAYLGTSLLIGGTTSIYDLELNKDAATANIAAKSHGTSAVGGGIYRMEFSRGTRDSEVIVNSGDRVGVLVFMGYDGAAYQTLARIDGLVDGTPGAGDMPGRIVFYTSPDGSTTAAEVLRLASDKLATFAGAVTVVGLTTLAGAIVKVHQYVSLYANGNSGTAKTVDWNNGNRQSIVTTGTCTLTFTAPTGGPAMLSLKIIHENSATAYVYTWPTTVKWSGGTKLATTDTANAVDMVTMFYDGTNYYATGTANFS